MHADNRKPLACDAAWRCLVLAAVLLPVGLGPSHALASCGDYVVIGGGESAVASGMHQTATHPMAERTGLPLGGCQGPDCRRERESSPTPAIPTRLHRDLSAVSWSAGDWVVCPVSFQTLSSPSAESLSGFPDGVERPPRSLPAISNG